MNDQYESELVEWIKNERLALDLLETASKLQFDKSAELVLFRRKVFDKKVSEIINDHAYGPHQGYCQTGHCAIAH
jgi:glyceraldehyde 3-phosphate dehydrogenase